MRKQTVINNEDVLAALIEAVRGCSLGQITETLYEVGGQYRLDSAHKSGTFPVVARARAPRTPIVGPLNAVGAKDNQPSSTSLTF